MTIDDHTKGLKESVSTDTAPAEPVLAACSGLTVSTDGEGVTVTDAGAEGASLSAFGGQVHVTEREEPTGPTSLQRATESTVEWTLQREDNP